MGRPRILDLKLVRKIGRKTGKDNTSVGITVSKAADKLGISSEAALIILAKKHGIGTATYQRRLDFTKQAEVRDALPGIFGSRDGTASSASTGKRSGSTKSGASPKVSLRLAIEYLIQDQELLSRCGDILLAAKNFDRPVNQATLVLEDRIRRKAKPPTQLVGENLVNHAFNDDLARTVLRVASGDPNDQRGFIQILRGIVPAFRNKTHHHVVDSFTRPEAMAVCGFIDVLLRVVDNSEKIR
jgi:hypothetical protein